MIPIVQILLAVKSLSSEKIYNKRATKGVVHWGVCYYNPISGKLEPILEPTGFLLGFIESQYSNPEQYLTIELEDVLKPLNFNVSEDMIAGLLRTYYSLSSELELFRSENNEKIKTNLPYQGKLLRKNTFSKKYYQDYMKYVSIYSITNDTGYDLELVRDEAEIKKEQKLQRKFGMSLSHRNDFDSKIANPKVIQNSQTEDFEVHSDESDFGQTFHRPHAISFRFRTFSGVQAEIRDVELTRVRTKKYPWTPCVLKGYFIADIRTIGSKKNLRLSSEGLFRNYIDSPVVIAMKSPRFKQFFVELEREQQKAVPHEFFEEMGSFQLKLSNGNEDYYNTSVSTYNFLLIE